MDLKVGQVAAPGQSPYDLLRTFFQRESETLKPTLRRYVATARLATGNEIEAVAAELLQEVVVQAMEIADKFDVSRNPVPWVLRIANNLVMRRKTEKATQHRRFADAHSASAEDREDGRQSPDGIFDRMEAAAENPEEFLSGRQSASRWLDLVSASDRQVIKIAILNDMDGGELAAALKITPGAARVRLHRSLERLRKALSEQPEVIKP